MLYKQSQLFRKNREIIYKYKNNMMKDNIYKRKQS